MTTGTHDTRPSTSSDSPSRRRFLTLAATGTLASVGAIAGAKAQSRPQTIHLGGKATGWVGRAPASIAGKTNPTLHLEAGETYRITWENADGRPHNVALLDGEDRVLKRTPFVSKQGATQTIEFTARKEMAEYVCQAHLASMRGDIRIGSGSKATETGSSGADGSNRFFPKGTTIKTETIVDGGLTAPLGFEVPPGERDRFFIVDQVGQIYTYASDGSGKDLFLDLSDQLIDFDTLPGEKTIDERGLLGLAFHPDFQQNRKFYVHYSAPPRPGTPENYTHTQVLSEFKATADLREALPETERTVMELPSPYYTHNGGAIVFGPDGYLYMGMGNGGGALESPKQANDWYEANLGGNGQDVTENLLGSILRIDVDSREDGKPYGIPDDNPLVGKKGLDEHYAWGFRNPWRIGFSNGMLMAGDVGQARYEEVNVVRKGGNYGWNVREGGHCFVATKGEDSFREHCPTHTPPNVRGGELLIDPVVEYPHTYKTEGVGTAVIGGHIYDNATIPALSGKYVFGDYSQNIEPRGSLFAATPVKGDAWETEELTIENSENGELNAYLLCVGQDNRGELYALTTDNLGVKGNTGAVHRIRPPESEATPTPTTETPERPPTATATPEPTPTAQPTTTQTQTAQPTENETETTAHTGRSGGIVSGAGPGFGVLAGLAGLLGVAARLLSSRED
jgi:glucose/arabinose dehydrogenase/plastocyanin